jgi:hypothetical protein
MMQGVDAQLLRAQVVASLLPGAMVTFFTGKRLDRLGSSQ